MRREQKALGVYIALLLGVLALLLLFKDRRGGRIRREPVLRVWSDEDRKIRMEVYNWSSEDIFIPDCLVIPPDAIPASFSVEIKEGDRVLLRLPPESSKDTQPPLFGIVMTYRRIGPGKSYAEDIYLANLPRTAPNNGRQVLSCTVQVYYEWERDSGHDSRKPVPHLEGGSSADSPVFGDFPGAHRLRHCFKLRRLAQTVSR